MAISPGYAQYARYLLSGDHTAAGKTPPLPNPTLSGAAGGGVGSGPGAPSGEQVTAMTAGYQDTADTCAGCVHFISDGQPCQVVSDPVQSSGWCKLFSSGGEGEGSAQQPGTGSGAGDQEPDADDEDNSGPTVDPDQPSPGPSDREDDEENT